jgi:hypothetical protein
MTKKLLGYVGVDSGQLIITDPCYIDSEWQHKEFQDIRIYKHLKTKKIFQYANILTPKPINKHTELFRNYDEILSTNKTMNQMMIDKEVKEIPDKNKQKLIGDYSYAGCCETTMADKNQLNYKKGHKGVAITFSSGYGDGCYPVYGTFNKDNRCIKVEINCNLTKTQSKFINSFKIYNKTTK